MRVNFDIDLKLLSVVSLFIADILIIFTVPYYTTLNLLSEGGTVTIRLSTGLFRTTDPSVFLSQFIWNMYLDPIYIIGLFILGNISFVVFILSNQVKEYFWMVVLILQSLPLPFNFLLVFTIYHRNRGQYYQNFLHYMNTDTINIEIGFYLLTFFSLIKIFMVLIEGIRNSIVSNRELVNLMVSSIPIFLVIFSNVLIHSTVIHTTNFLFGTYNHTYYFFIGANTDLILVFFLIGFVNAILNWQVENLKKVLYMVNIIIIHILIYLLIESYFGFERNMEAVYANRAVSLSWYIYQVIAWFLSYSITIAIIFITKYRDSSIKSQKTGTSDLYPDNNHLN